MLLVDSDQLLEVISDQIAEIKDSYLDRLSYYSVLHLVTIIILSLLGLTAIFSILYFILRLRCQDRLEISLDPPREAESVPLVVLFVNAKGIIEQLQEFDVLLKRLAEVASENDLKLLKIEFEHLRPLLDEYKTTTNQIIAAKADLDELPSLYNFVIGILSLRSPLKIDDLLKARQQLKRAECESDLNTDEEGSLKRKRKQKQYSSSDENDDNGVTIKNRLSTQIPSPPPPTSNQGNTSTDLEKHVTILETQDNSTHFTQALENVAKKLAKICQRLDAIEENQRKILEKVGNECSEPVQEVQNLPEGLIPCSSLDEIKRLENWLKEAVHEATLVWISYL
ncbi:hypothetical protein FQA39_LY00260 [Lamprigera yunnana]|nr:hypothetical protein FQA39_LY00260 [Lamprigera yunnana]